tara:strand:+ start:84 stop:413 length:330 start_codon:yes stop_codon:yes gene_type:complete
MHTKTTLDCGVQLTITQLELWYLHCLKLLLAGDSIYIDVSRLQKIDTAALQLLYQFYQQAQHYGIQVVWSDMSENFQDAVNLSGLMFTMENQQSSDESGNGEKLGWPAY